ncbi:MAG: DUF2330 domain-containing protein [Candidatus Binatia bacterium]
MKEIRVEKMLEIRRTLLASSLVAALWWSAPPPEAEAFCGFYVGKADASLYNQASQVVVARHDGRTVISMMNDYKGELTEFALVVPVPVVLEKGQIHVGERELFTHLDAYTAPRLVEYFDDDPCRPIVLERMAPMAAAPAMRSADMAARAKSLGVTVEAEYTVGEYDIVILSAKESDGLETWLKESGYRIPEGASRALKPYIQQEMKFFVAKVNLKEQTKTGLSYLRPLQFAFESPKFMLPIRLGMVNAKGSQDLILYMLTKGGRVETTNYRTVKLPSGMDVPEYVKGDFASFYKAMFEEQVNSEKMRAVFTEYVWNMGWCDPCAADPLSRDELRKLGVFWLDGERPGGRIMPPRPMPFPGGALPVMVTRLHVRYSPDTFPEDLVFQETSDQENYQGRYVLRHAWQGSAEACPAAKQYFEDLKRRREKEAQTLASLAGWKLDDIRKKMDLGAAPKPGKWWETLWK